MTRTQQPQPERGVVPLKPLARTEIEQRKAGQAAVAKLLRLPVEDRLAPHDGYETETVVVDTLAGKTVEHVTINRAHTVFDKWLSEDEGFFLRRHVRVVEHARELWRSMARSSTIYTDEWLFDTAGAMQIFDDENAARAANLLRRARSLVAPWKWTLFENVVRWNEPYGFPGSRLYGDDPKRERWAKLVVRDVAEVVGKALFL